MATTYACNKRPDDPIKPPVDPKKQDFLPLTVVNEWRYSITLPAPVTAAKTKAKSPAKPTVSEFTLKVNELKGEKAFDATLAFLPDGGGQTGKDDPQTYRLTKTTEDLVLHLASWSELPFQSPAKASAKFSRSAGSKVGIPEITFPLLNLSREYWYYQNMLFEVQPTEKIKVKAGEFECRVVSAMEFASKTDVYKAWFAKDIGLVRLSVSMPSTAKPSPAPSTAPSAAPSTAPSTAPSVTPSGSPVPSAEPSPQPSASVSAAMLRRANDAPADPSMAVLELIKFTPAKAEGK